MYDPGTGNVRPTGPGRVSIVLACCLLLGAGALASPLFASSASAGDQPAVFTIEPEEVETDPGETVELDVVVYNHGPLHGQGLSEISFDVRYDPGTISDVTVEHDEWLLDGDEDAELDTSSEVDGNAGLISVEHEREPAGTGVLGDGAVATLSLTVAEDADSTTLELAFEDTSAIIPSGTPHYVWDHEATVHVGDAVGDTGSESDDVDGVTLGDDADLTETDSEDRTAVGDEADDETLPVVDPDGTEPETDEHGDRTTAPVPGFGVLVAVLALAAVLVLAAAGSTLVMRHEP